MKRHFKMLFIVLTQVLMISFQAVAAENPDDLYRQGRFSEAEKAYAQKDMDRPKDIRYRYNRGCSAYQNSDFETAKAAFSSVLRRSEGELVRFRAFFNLGNTFFKLGDFESAAEQYRQAILCRPASEDARYNLELSLRELEKRKKKREQERQGQKDAEGRGGKKDSDQNSTHEREREKGRDQSGKEDPSKGKKEGRENEGRKAKKGKTRDYSGELKPLQEMPGESKEDQPQVRAGAMLDRKKAEALLKNLKEDRSRFLRFQVPSDKKDGVPSGKDW